MIWRSSIFVLAGLAVLLPWVEAVSVMSVDLGTEWMKVAIVSPGVPMEIALNKESKRKTPVNIALRDGERTFGEDAASVGVRFPKNSYIYLLELLGKKIDNPIVQLFKKRFPYYDIVADPDRNTVLFQHDSETQFSPEELIGMILHKAKEFAQDAAHGQPINEAVLTVPGYFNQAERQAMLQAANLAGLKVLQLMNDYTAVALNYGIFRSKDFNETAQYIMFYDMGASSTTATVVSYQTVKTKERGFVETHPQVSILGVAFDRTLGGFEVQLRLRDYLARRFNELKKTPSDVFKNPRSMAKLFKEAGRVKNVLSANADHYAQVEGLLDDVDFKLQVTRDQLEEMCTDLFDRVRAPVDAALKAAGLTMDVISQVILVGAGTRMPKIQERLNEAVGSELGKNLNTDEAAVMGAVYKAADLSAGFKVKKFITKDAVVFPVQVVFERELEAGGGTKQVKRILFGAMNPYPQKKILTFNKHLGDFSFQVNYAELDHLSKEEIEALGPLELSTVDLKGVAEALSKHQAKNVESKGIKAHFAMDDSGILSLVNVELLLEKTLTEAELAAEEESPLAKLGSKDADAEKPIVEDVDEGKQEGEGQEGKPEEAADAKPEAEEKPAAAADKDAAKPAANATKPADKRPKVVVIKEPIATVEKKSDVAALAGKRLEAAVAKIEALNEFDRQRNRREGALNALESFVFDAQNKLDTKEYKSAATKEEAAKIKQACSEISDWLYEEGADADAATYEDKFSELQALTRPAYRRVREHQERPEALAALKSMLNGSAAFLANAKNMTAAEADNPLFTPVEIETLEKAINEAKEWKAKMESEQKALKAFEQPILTIKSITDRMALLDREVKYLVNKAKIWKPKKAKDGEKNETVDEVSAGGEEATREEGSAGQETAGEEPEVAEQEEKEVPKPTRTKDNDDESHTEL